MKQLVRIVTVVSLIFAASCNRGALTPAQAIGAPLAVANPNLLPPTVHVIPFYSYGKSGYDSLGAPGSSGGLIGSETELYGATLLGGNTKCSTPFDSGSETGCGIVYRLVPNKGKRRYKIEILHVFEGAPADGAASAATLLADKSGDLYGTTYYGGKYNGGTLFKLHPTSAGYTETIVHSFGHGKDGAYPISGAIEVDGILYGTTVGGGAHTNQTLCGHYGGVSNGTCGAVYRVDPATGAERVLHSFGKTGDGASPFAALLNVAGTLYGTTDLGGSSYYCGTVFSIGVNGKGEKVVHNFLNAQHGDGCNPFASLISVSGTLYGTTCCGGGNFCGHCHGTLFSVDIASGAEQVLHKFGQAQDGSEPHAAVVDAQGVLYGTTDTGGGTSCVSGFGCGTVFSFAPSPSNPAYNVLYAFTGGKDGADPLDSPLYSHRAFYLTTVSGGKKGLGTGVKLRQ